MRLKTVPLLLLALLGVGPVMALEFGNISVLSRLGQPFRAEVQLLEEAGDSRLGTECFKLSQPDSANSALPSLPQGRVTVARDGGRTRLLIVSDRAIDEPVVQFSLRVLCGPLQYRSYSALMDPASSSSAQAADGAKRIDRVTAAPPSPASKKAAASGPVWVCDEGESAHSIATSIFSTNAVARSRFLSALLNANPDIALGTQGEQRLSAGTVLRLPETRHLPTGKPARIDRQRSADLASTTQEKAKAGSEPAVKPEAGKIVGASNDTASLRTAPSLPPDPVPESVPRTPGQTASVAIAPPSPTTPDIAPVSQAPITPHPVTVATPTATPKVASPSQPQEAEENEVGITDWLLELVTEWSREILAVLGLIALLLVWKSTKRRSARRELASGKSKVVERDPLSVIEDDVRSEIKATRAPRALSAAPSDAGGAKDAEQQWVARHGDTMVVKKDSEFNPVMELAEIMLSFGRVKGAAQALQEYIDKNPNEALQPWMKLLEVYRQGDMRAEFENLTEKLKLHFNVAPADWETMTEHLAPPVSPIDEETAPVEQLLTHLPNIARMPRIRDEITRTWDSPEGFDYLNALLRDNRKGERQGFPLSIVSELLYMMDILEKRLKRLAA